MVEVIKMVYTAYSTSGFGVLNRRNKNVSKTKNLANNCINHMSSNIQIPYTGIQANVVLISPLDKHTCLVKKSTLIQCIVKINVHFKV